VPGRFLEPFEPVSWARSPGTAEELAGCHAQKRDVLERVGALISTFALDRIESFGLAMRSV